MAWEESNSELVHIEQLFNKTWYRSEEKLGTWRLICYAPFGLIFLLIRLGILLQFFLLKQILPESKLKSNALRVMGAILGVTVSTEGEIAGPSFASNHITILDHFVIHCVTGGLYFTEETTVPKYLHALFGVTTDASDTAPVIHFPETESTNGIGGLLTFVDIPSADGKLVQPIAIAVSRPFLNVNNIHCGPLSELFYTLFSPNTHFTLKFLYPEPWNGVRIQRAIASSLSIQPTKFRKSDKEELLKKLNFRPMSMASKARLVQQQLHPVVLSAESVISAIQKTGTVEEAVQELRKSMAQPSFHKNASERMMCFQERKRLLIQTAREKYAEKHGILLK